MYNIDNPVPFAFVCCPFVLLKEKFWDKILSLRINPEIGITSKVLDEYLIVDFLNISKKLKENGLNATIHAPFWDLSIGALDPLVRDITKKRLLRTLEIASIFEAKSVVIHTGFDTWHYVNYEDIWMQNALDTLEKLVIVAEKLGILLVLENVFEPGPEIHRKIFDHIRSSYLGFCLDVGHQNVFAAKGLSFWLDSLGDWLKQLHLHDNHGRRDEHLRLGSAGVDFDFLFKWLKEKSIKPIMTVEAHKEEDVLPSLNTLASYLKRYELEAAFL